MTSFIEIDSVTVVDELNTLISQIDADVGYCKNRHFRHVLKSKENSYKHKCNKLLKRKLKKYKLRQDGKEDQDVLDVSKILVSSLIIKSPNTIRDPFIKDEDFNCVEDLRPKNYLFKMGRRKETVKSSNSVKSPSIQVKPQDTVEMPEAMTIQEKKHMNAFQLLMDSRNKSIGGNSPGKERSDDHSDNEEIFEKNTLKVKRKLLLQKMAEAKGYLKNKEMEENQDKIIKKKMDKRAERLKIMILKETKSAKLNEDLDYRKDGDSSKLDSKNKNETCNNNESKKKSKALKIVDIFNTLSDPIILSPEKRHVSKDDQEFLKKLSPSLKKKESMLSYFKKVEKDSEFSPHDSENDNLIKVKLQVKPKKKSKKKKLSLKRDMLNDDLDDAQNFTNENDVVTCNSNSPMPHILPLMVESSETKSNNERPNRKKNAKIDNIQRSEDAHTILNNEGRPRRSVKRPIKYTDDAFMSSSDDDLHIFTPKKQKHIKTMSEEKVTVNTKCNQIADKPTVEKKGVKEGPKKPTKLAPIFATKQLDTAAFEAKQKFLHSGVPDKLKKIIQQQKNNSVVSSDFPTVVHVQQKNTVDEIKNHPFLNLLKDDNNDEIWSLTSEVDAYKKLLKLDEFFCADNVDKNIKKSIQTILQSIKQLHPKFPVYRTYHYLRSKGQGEFKDCNIDFDNSIEVMSDVLETVNNSPDRLNWTDKYKASSTNKIVGNFESIKELRKWLISWTENEIKSKSKGNTGSDSSDYYQSDTDSRESLKTMNNLLILTGPTGCGKTSSVYAVAAELAMKVIEVNASSKRTGKIMLQDLQEATQSHKVNRGTDSSQKSQEKNLTELLKKNKKKGRPKKSTENLSKKSSDKIEVLGSTPLSQESTRTDMSLILIDDADIVFDQDDGFSSAIVQLVNSSKRPVILITSSLLCPHLQKFLLYGKVLKMYSLMPRLLGTWLDIMCLADTGVTWPGIGAKFLNYFNGDIRKTVNYLQFYILSYANSMNSNEETGSQNIDCYKPNIDDENSSMSWVDHEESEEKKITPLGCNSLDWASNSMWINFINTYSNLSKFIYPMQLFNIWWSLPHLLNIPGVPHISLNKPKNNICKVKELEAIADVIDAISLSDYTSHAHPNPCFDITARPWYSSENDSVSELDNIDYYLSKHEIADEICHTVVTGYITAAQDILNCDRKTDINFPGMSLQRQKNRVVSRHKSLTSYLNPWAMLDRRSLALDYWSSCRTICRLEKSKSDSNVNLKRNNRFCHYLKSLSVLCKSDTFDNLCDSLSDRGTKLNIFNFNE